MILLKQGLVGCTQGMELLVDYDFIAIFDADFKPEPDFLVRSVTRQMHWHACYAHAPCQLSRCCHMRLHMRPVTLVKERG